MSAKRPWTYRAARSLGRLVVIVGLSVGAGAGHIEWRFPKLRWLPDPQSISSSAQRKAEVSISAETMRALIDAAEDGTLQVAVIDARPREEFLRGHVAASTILNIHGDERYEYDPNVLDMVRGFRIVLYCTSLQCELAELVYDMLVKDYGFADLVIYPEGWQGWEAAGYPTETGPEKYMGMPLDALLGAADPPRRRHAAVAGALDAAFDDEPIDELEPQAVEPSSDPDGDGR